MPKVNRENKCRHFSHFRMYINLYGMYLFFANTANHPQVVKDTNKLARIVHQTAAFMQCSGYTDFALSWCFFIKA